MSSLLVASLLVLLGMALFYFIPTFIALLRGHPQTLAIFVSNLFGGITGIAWLVTLIWSLLPVSEPAHYKDRGWW